MATRTGPITRAEISTDYVGGSGDYDSATWSDLGIILQADSQNDQNELTTFRTMQGADVVSQERAVKALACFDLESAGVTDALAADSRTDPSARAHLAMIYGDSATVLGLRWAAPAVGLYGMRRNSNEKC